MRGWLPQESRDYLGVWTLWCRLVLKKQSKELVTNAALWSHTHQASVVNVWGFCVKFLLIFLLIKISPPWKRTESLWLVPFLEWQRNSPLPFLQNAQLNELRFNILYISAWMLLARLLKWDLFQRGFWGTDTVLEGDALRKIPIKHIYCSTGKYKYICTYTFHVMKIRVIYTNM